MFLPFGRAVGLAFLPLALAGCGAPSGEPALIPVSGTVTLDKKPLAGAVLTFIPTGKTRGGLATARTGPDGRYTLQSKAGSGVLPGEYRVVISKRVMPDGSDVPADDSTPPMRSPARETLPFYSDPSKPALTATVTVDGVPIDFPLQSQAAPR